MKIVFFSDIHGNKYVLQPFIKAIKKDNVDKVIFCGDVFGYYYYQNEIINTFREHDFKMLLGNHDKNFLDIIDGKVSDEDFTKKYGNSYRDIVNRVSIDNTRFLRSLKSHYEIKTDNIKIGIFHGTPINPLNGRLYPNTEINEKEIREYEKYDFVILGHTHHKMVRNTNSTTILNPGSIGQQRDGKGCSYLVLDTNTREYFFKIIDFDIDFLVNDIDKYDGGNLSLKEVLYRYRKRGEINDKF